MNEERQSTTQAPACQLDDTDHHCLTCSDEALPVKVIRIDEEARLALVEVRNQVEEIDITLVENVALGDMLLAHSGVAIARVQEGIEARLRLKSEYDKLFYPYLFEGGTARVEDVLAQVYHSTREKCQETIALRRATLERSGEHIVAAAKAMAQAFAAGATLLAFGNGGSATDVQDLVSELLHPPLPGCSPLPAIALTNDIAVITAIGNDVGFEHIFARQIIAFGRRGDIAFGISTSGNSPNMLLAFEQAKKQGLFTIALAGYDGGKTASSPAVDVCIVSPGEHIPRIQEAQATVYHALLAVIHASLRV